MERSLKMKAVKSGIFGDGIDLYLWQRSGNGLYVAKSPELTLIKHPEGFVPSDPCIKLEVSSAQYLMDTLWECGLRPSEGSGSAGAMLAVESHLSDMRKIAFKKLGIQGV